METHRFSEIILACVVVVTGLPLGCCRETVLVSSAVKCVKQLEKVLLAA